MAESAKKQVVYKTLCHKCGEPFNPPPENFFKPCPDCQKKQKKREGK